MATVTSILANKFLETTQAAACKIPRGKYIPKAALPVQDPCQDRSGRRRLLAALSAAPGTAPLLSGHFFPPQDMSDALSTAELQEELALHALSGQRELFLLPTSATWASLSTTTSVLHVKNLLVTLLSQS